MNVKFFGFWFCPTWKTTSDFLHTHKTIAIIISFAHPLHNHTGPTTSDSEFTIP